MQKERTTLFGAQLGGVYNIDLAEMALLVLSNWAGAGGGAGASMPRGPARKTLDPHPPRREPTDKAPTWKTKRHYVLSHMAGKSHTYQGKEIRHLPCGAGRAGRGQRGTGRGSRPASWNWKMPADGYVCVCHSPYGIHHE